jgi:hypothetical protein
VHQVHPNQSWQLSQLQAAASLPQCCLYVCLESLCRDVLLAIDGVEEFIPKQAQLLELQDQLNHIALRQAD